MGFSLPPITVPKTKMRLPVGGPHLHRPLTLAFPSTLKKQQVRHIQHTSVSFWMVSEKPTAVGRAPTHSTQVKRTSVAGSRLLLQVSLVLPTLSPSHSVLIHLVLLQLTNCPEKANFTNKRELHSSQIWSAQGTAPPPAMA